MKSAILDWIGRKTSSKVRLVESNDPPNEPNQDHRVVYEAVLESADLDRMRAEIWLTEEGGVAVGLETRDRVSLRVGARNWRPGFAAGHEFAFVSEGGLITLLECIASGEIAIDVGIGVFGLGRTSASVTARVRERLLQSGYDAIKFGNQDRSLLFGQRLTYRTW